MDETRFERAHDEARALGFIGLVCAADFGDMDPATARRQRKVRRAAMRLEFSAPLSCNRLAFSIQAPEKWRRYLQTHRIPRFCVQVQSCKRSDPGTPLQNDGAVCACHIILNV
jgi:hypothetical protein